MFAFVFADAIDDARADLDARDWTLVNGTIIASGVDSYRESDGNTTYCLRIEYEYDYENETYSGDMISHSIHSSTYDAQDNVAPRVPMRTNTLRVKPLPFTWTLMTQLEQSYLLVGLDLT